MRASKRNGRIVWIIFIIGLVIQILFDPLSGMLKAIERIKGRIELPSARSKWESQGITHYSFDVSGGVAMGCFLSGNVEVRDDIIIRADPRSDDNQNNYFYSPEFWTLDDGHSLCNHEIYTVNRLFSELETWLLDTPLIFTGMDFAVTEISFDPTYGFVSHFRVGNCGGLGLLSPKISDCSGGFVIENFQVLDK